MYHILGTITKCIHLHTVIITFCMQVRLGGLSFDAVLTSTAYSLHCKFAARMPVCPSAYIAIRLSYTLCIFMYLYSKKVQKCAVRMCKSHGSGRK